MSKNNYHCEISSCSGDTNSANVSCASPGMADARRIKGARPLVPLDGPRRISSIDSDWWLQTDESMSELGFTLSRLPVQPPSPARPRRMIGRDEARALDLDQRALLAAGNASRSGGVARRVGAGRSRAAGISARTIDTLSQLHSANCALLKFHTDGWRKSERVAESSPVIANRSSCGLPKLYPAARQNGRTAEVSIESFSTESSGVCPSAPSASPQTASILANGSVYEYTP